MRVENLRLSLHKEATVHSEKSFLRVVHKKGGTLKLPLWTSFLLSKLDGSVFFSDILRAQKYRIERSTKLREIVEAIYDLAKNDLLENSGEVKRHMQTLLTKGETSSEELQRIDSIALGEPEPVAFDQQRLIYYLRKTPLMGSAQDAYFRKLLKHSEVLAFPAGSKIIGFGEESKELYVLLEGRAGVYTPMSEGGSSKFLALLQPVTVFGESAAVLGKKRTADVISLDDSTLLRVNLHKILGPQEDTSLTDFSSLRTRLLLHQILFSSSLFSGLPSEVFQLVLEKSSKLEVTVNQPVVHQDADDKSFYLILKGSIGVYREGERVASLSRGDHFGEIAALFNRPRTASLKAFSPSILLKISQEDMIDLTCEHLSLGLHLEEVALSRLQAPRTHKKPDMPMGISLENIDDLSNPFGNVHDGDSSFLELPLRNSGPIEMDELELDFNFDFNERE